MNNITSSTNKLQVIRVPKAHVGYHFFITKDGTIYQTRKLSEEGAHVIGMNSKSIGVCFAGNFDLTVPTKEQMESWYKVYGDLIKIYPGIPTYPHRKYATKTCHGRLLKDDYFSVQYQIFSLEKKIDQLRSLLLNLLTQRRQK